ncbi:MAG TPA: transcriptional regulator [Metalysinibacillus jejuensis]|uniref:Transcriptional regulator n=1 Tax=Metalysinibacillus jejuensis TaxID=914327 RepID=A0A921NC57_9BACL|nr:transcriptional regulator [Metalysinibacillus jejuensis]HJH11695.1 transcriptional regulator [Metalysinibacillus jejuensis]
MQDYRTGYEYYKKACEAHGLKPINFHYYIMTLSEEQLAAYNESAYKDLHTIQDIVHN